MCTGTPPQSNGICVPAGAPPINAASVTDGLANTICIGEGWDSLDRLGLPNEGRVVGWVAGRPEQVACNPQVPYLPSDTQRVMTDLFGPNSKASHDPEPQRVCNETGSVPQPSGSGQLRIRWAFLP